MENPYPKELIELLSMWSKQLTLEWHRDTIFAIDLGQAAMNAGWRSPVDKVVMGLGMVAELYAFELAYNIANKRAPNEQDLDFRDVCEGLTIGESIVIDGQEFFHDFPLGGAVVELQPTPLGSQVGDLVDSDLSWVELPDKTPLINEAVPETDPDETDFFRPGAAGRAALLIGGNGIRTPQTFFQAAHRLGYTNSRNQAVLGFGTLAHLLTTGAITAGTLHGTAITPDDRKAAQIYRDLAHWWFTEAPNLEYNTWITPIPRPAPPPTPVNTAFAPQLGDCIAFWPERGRSR
ncbi:hypothetical protein ACSBOX_02430 [Arthrobacter sp. KN11-1C]|uniref:hypothetical protein n=1 Tax=Arthrobacter sp. KN11-1C TaxID=3445774 RepID=UPI003F9FE25D